MKTHFLLNDELDPGERLKEARLYAKLCDAFGAEIIPVSSWNHREIHQIIQEERRGEAQIWGKSPHVQWDKRHIEKTQIYADPEIQRMMQGKIVKAQDLDAEVKHWSDLNLGVIMRNMRDPQNYLRFTQPGENLDAHKTAIRLEDRDEVFVCPNKNLEFMRRFIIIDGEIAAETPYHYPPEGKASQVSKDNAWNMQARDFWRELEDGPIVIREIEREIAEYFNRFVEMRSGALDIGVVIQGVGVTAHIEDVIAGPPGSFDLFYANLDAYMERLKDSSMLAHLQEKCEDLEM